MSLCAIMSTLGLTLALVGAFTAGITKQRLLLVLTLALALTTGITRFEAYQHEKQVSKIADVAKAKLAHERWTYEQIHAEMPATEPKLIHEALDRSVENGSLDYDLTYCLFEDGSHLPTVVYYIK